MMTACVSPLKTGSAVSSSEFLHAFNNIWERAGRGDFFNRKQNLCLAVSGGSDSMALAFLCQQLSRQLSQDHSIDLRFHALLVDHQLRENSHFEVTRTQERLRKMGLHSHIIRLEWPLGTSPPELQYFETKARRLRYQALGKACAQKGISKLCLGHHSDDQAETVLMNLANSRVSRTIRTMASMASIPECEGMHGIYRSGGFERSEERLIRLQQAHRRDSMSSKEPQLPANTTISPVCEAGGLEILRPLLTFSKERLRQTCIENFVEWEEDESNHDVRATARNTIRSVLSNSRLPRALQNLPLLQLANHEDIRAREIMKLRDEQLKRCKILKLDVRSGFSIVQLPTNFLAHGPLARSAAAEFLKELAEAVTPYESINLSALNLAVSIVFPHMQDSETHKTSTQEKALSFTSGGVHFQRQRLKRAYKNSKEPLSLQHDDGLNPEHVWMFSRQPFSDASRPNHLSFSLEKPIELWETTPSQTSVISPVGQKKDDAELWSAWQLWDGRFWVRIRRAINQNFIIRTWRECEMSSIRNRLTPSMYDKFHDALQDAAPGKIRWTLPVIAEIQDITKEDDTKDIRTSTKGHGQIGEAVVFPTLGRAGWINIFNRDGSRKLEWEIRYKKITLRRRDTLDMISGYDPEDLIAWDDGGQGRPTALPIE